MLDAESPGKGNSALLSLPQPLTPQPARGWVKGGSAGWLLAGLQIRPLLPSLCSGSDGHSRSKTSYLHYPK